MCQLMNRNMMMARTRQPPVLPAMIQAYFVYSSSSLLIVCAYTAVYVISLATNAYSIFAVQEVSCTTKPSSVMNAVVYAP